MAKVQSFDHIDKLNVNNLAKSLKINELATAQGATVPTDNNGLSFAFSTQAAKTKVSEALPNVQIDTHFLERLITGEAPKAKDECSRLARLFYEGGDASLNTLSNNEKNKLPYFLPSGFCAVHHNDASLIYNGCVQMDIDFKFQGGDVKAIEIKNQITALMQSGVLAHFVFVAISPRLYGVKALVFTDNQTKEHHKSLVQVLKTELSSLLNIDSKQMDNLSLSQPCFVPFDKTAFFNHNPTPYNYQHVEFAKTDAQKLAEQKARLQVNNAVTTNYEGEKLVISAFDKLTMCEAILRHKGTSAGRYRFCFELARMMTKYDVSLDETLCFCMDYVESDFSAKEVEQAVKGAYRYGKKAHFEDYQLLKYAKLLGTFIPSHLLEWKPRKPTNDRTDATSVHKDCEQPTNDRTDAIITSVHNDSEQPTNERTDATNVHNDYERTTALQKNIAACVLLSNANHLDDATKETILKGIHGEKYGSQVLQRFGIPKPFDVFKNGVLAMPTGAGKNYITKQIAKEDYIILAVSNNLMIEQSIKDGATAWYSEHKDIHKVFGSKFIVLNYNKHNLNSLLNAFDEQRHSCLEKIRTEITTVTKHLKNSEKKRFYKENPLTPLATEIATLQERVNVETKYNKILKAIQFKESVLKNYESVTYEGRKKANFLLNLEKVQSDLKFLKLQRSELQKEYDELSRLSNDAQLKMKSDLKNLKSEFEKALKKLQRTKKEKETVFAQFNGCTDIAKEYHFIFDEIHNVVANSNPHFQLEDIENILKHRHRFASFSGLTATPLPCDTLNMPLLRVQLERNAIQMHVLKCEHVRAATIQAIQKSVQRGHNVMLYLNNVGDELVRYKTALERLGIAYACVNSDTKKEGEALNIIENGVISENVKVVIATSVLKEGVNIQNNNDFDIYIVGSHHYISMVQFVARPRERRVTVFLMQGMDVERNENRFDRTAEKTKIIRASEWAMNELNLSKGETNEMIVKALKTIHKNLAIRKNEAGHYEIDTLRLDNLLYETETTYCNQNLNYLKEQLRFFDIELNVETDICTIEASNENKVSEKDAIKEYRETEQAVCSQILESVKNDSNAFKTIAKKAQTNSLSKIERQVYKSLNQSIELGYQDVNHLVTDYSKYIERPVKHQINDFHKKMIWYQLRTNNPFMASNGGLSIFIKSIMHRFEGKTLSSYEIKRNVYDVLGLVRMDTEKRAEYLNEKRIDKCLGLLEMFFDVEQSRKRAQKMVEGEPKDISFCVYTFEPVILNLEPPLHFAQLKENAAQLLENDFLDIMIEPYRFETDFTNVPF